MNKQMDELHACVSSLRSLATQGRTSIKTLLWLGGAVAAISGYFLMISDYFIK
jgi:hypothetical protein